MSLLSKWSPLFCCLLSCFSALSYSQAAADTVADKSETITYTLQDFSSFVPTGWAGQSEVVYTVAPELKVVHTENRGARLTWDFSHCTTQANSFANLSFRQTLVGHPQAIRAWIFAEPKDLGSSLSMTITDVSGEVYISRAKIDWSGWKQETIPVTPSPAWKSGDGNSVLDPPAQLESIGVDDLGGPLKGSLVIDNVEVVTSAEPRESLLAHVGEDAPFNTLWGDPGQLLVGVQNYSDTTVSGLKYQVTLTDEYTNAVAWKAEIPLTPVAAHASVHANPKFDLPYGLYTVDWKLLDDQGEIQHGQAEITRMMPADRIGLSPAEDAYLQRTGPWGGVYWQATDDIAMKAGARWKRNWMDWQSVEKVPGVLDFSPYVKSLRETNAHGIRSITLMTLYDQPKFYQNDQIGFAEAYGRFAKGMSASLLGSADGFELGNEENGPTKYLYTEVARNGAAGVRQANAKAVVANAATAFVDTGWLRMQGDRGLYDWIDALAVHPYTLDNGPEKWGLYDQAQNVIQYGDELGGMKRFWTTEFGWDQSEADISEQQRADWSVRHFLIAIAAGYDNDGLYSWDGAFGIFHDSWPYLPAVSVHTMAKFLEGYRCAGLLNHDDNAWAVVWEKFGKPVLVAWTPNGEKDWTVPVGEAKVRVFDLFGNPLPVNVQNGQLTLHLTTGPQYVIDGPPSLTQAAWSAQLKLLQDRYRIHLDKTSLKSDPALEQIAQTSAPDQAALFAALSTVSTKHPNAPRLEVRGVESNLLKMLMLKARMGQISVGDPSALQTAASFPATATAAITQAHSEDVDLQGLRWALDIFQDLEVERRFAQSDADTDYAHRLLSAEAILATFAERHLTGPSEETLTAVWPYLYTTAPDGKSLKERLVFTPGSSTKVDVRIDNYALHNYLASVTLDLPKGWSSTPKVRTLALQAGKNAETSFSITCALQATDKPRIVANLAIPGKPLRQLTFDDIEVAPAVSVTAEPVEGLLASHALQLILTNKDVKPVSGTVRLLLKDAVNAPALGRATFSDLPPGQTQTVSVPLSASRPGNEWPLVAEIDLADGRKTSEPFNVDFSAAVEATTPPKIDGDLSDWGDALPLHIDRNEYTLGSYGNNWTPQDESATTWVKWDDHYFYFAALVHDQTFNQNMHGQAIWAQDSIQIGIAASDTGPYTEFGLAKTPQGEEIYRFTDPSGDAEGAHLKVALSQGQAIYEAAIPWSQIAGITHPALGMDLRYDVLLNDDDAVIPRRYMERYGNGIVNTKNLKDYGHLYLIGPNTSVSSTPAAPNDPNSVLKEDFEEYPDGGQPDTWMRFTQMQPIPDGGVRAGAGRNGSKALVFKQSAPRTPFVYLHYVRPLDNLEAGSKYILHAWMHGKGITTLDGVIGLCSDLSGNEGYIYAPGGPPTGDWQEINLLFTAPASTYNLILRCDDKMDELDIDDVSIEKLTDKS